MSIWKGMSWECERCHTMVYSPPWPCPVCGKETCDRCFDRYAVCRDCTGDKSDSEVKHLVGLEWDEEFDSCIVA